MKSLSASSRKPRECRNIIVNLTTDPDAPIEPMYATMQRDLVALVESARDAAARRVNALMSAVYWEIGRRIVETEQQGAERAGKVRR